MLGLYVDALHLSVRSAGFVIAFEAAGYVLAQIAFSMWLHHRSRARLAIASIVVVVVANLLTAHAGEFWPLALLRLSAGLGMGITFAILTSSIAGREKPSRDYAIFAASNLLYAGALFVVATPVVSSYGLSGLTAMMAAVAAVGFLTIGSLPSSVATPGGTTLSRADVVAMLNSPQGWAAVRLALTLMVLYAGHNALWAYQERMGLAVGLSPQSVGALLGASIVFGSVGAVCAALLGTRWGFTWPQMAGLGVVIFSGLLLALGASPLTYIFAAMLVKVGWFFGVPLLQGAVAKIDPTGRALVAAGALQTLGAMIGPAAAATVVSNGYALVGLVGIGFYLLSVPLSFGVFRQLDRARAMTKTA